VYRWVASILFLLSCLVITVPAPAQEHEDLDAHHTDWGRHHPEDRYEHRDWNYERDRMVRGQRFPNGRFDYDGGDVHRLFVAGAFDYRSRRVVLEDHSSWVVAAYDRDRCRDWHWGRDKVVVYEDDIHSGWYVLFNVRVGAYLHVEYFGR
jgi:hypothetical protein